MDGFVVRLRYHRQINQILVFIFLSNLLEAGQRGTNPKGIPRAYTAQYIFTNWYYIIPIEVLISPSINHVYIDTMSN